MIELGKKYRTRDGREARVYAVDGDLDRRVHGATKEVSGWTIRSWFKDGCYWSDCRGSNDLIEVIPEVTVRVYLHKDRNPNYPEAVVSMKDHIMGMMTLGAINITHNSKKITDVKVVK